MQRIIAGATGLIGQYLVNHWLQQGHVITVIGRSHEHIKKIFADRVKAITWDTLTQADLQSAEVIINLAGASVGEKAWTDARKKEIIKSRIDSTNHIATLLAPLGKKSPPFFNASAIGIYGLQDALIQGLPNAFTEENAIDWNHAPDFLSHVGRLWEQATQAAINAGARVVFLRFGVVLAKKGGALPLLIKPFKLFLGGKLGNGQQAFSWVAIDDVIRAIDFLLAKQDSVGAYNVVAPQCVRQETFAKTLAKVMRRPSWLAMPTFMLQKLLGKEMANELLLSGQHVYPKRLCEAGFHFDYPTIELALSHLLN